MFRNIIELCKLYSMDGSSLAGSVCTFSSAQGLNRPGICRLAQHCPWLQLLSGADRVFPRICSFSGNEPVVCCPHESDSVLFPENSLLSTSTTLSPEALATSTPKIPPRPPPPPPPSDTRPGSEARRKCVEYEEWAPKQRYGPEGECVPNHKYPIGGNPALPKEFAHMALLGYGPRDSISYQCGGSLISRIWVLTAAHCLVSRGSSEPVRWVKLGELVQSIDTDDAFPQVIPVERSIAHPNFNRPAYYNDIALLKLAWSPNMTTRHVRPACLHVDRELAREKLYLTGWGLTEFGGEPADALMEVALYRTHYEECRRWWEGDNLGNALPRGVDNDTQICAGQGQLKQDACNGDSGGPLQTPIIKSTCMFLVVGVVSLGQGCGFGAAGIYTRVSTYVPWIENLVWPDP